MNPIKNYVLMGNPGDYYYQDHLFVILKHVFNGKILNDATLVSVLKWDEEAQCWISQDRILLDSDDGDESLVKMAWDKFTGEGK